jgi:hypothetical protein
MPISLIHTLTKNTTTGMYADLYTYIDEIYHHTDVVFFVNVCIEISTYAPRNTSIATLWRIIRHLQIQTQTGTYESIDYTDVFRYPHTYIEKEYHHRDVC